MNFTRRQVEIRVQTSQGLIFANSWDLVCLWFVSINYHTDGCRGQNDCIVLYVVSGGANYEIIIRVLRIIFDESMRINLPLPPRAQ